MISNEEIRYYNYIYLDPEKPGEYKYNIDNKEYLFKYEPFYVGKGTGKRCNQHKWYACGKSMKSKIKSLKEKNIIPIINKLNLVSEKESLDLETKLIQVIGRKDLNKGPLRNLTDGGEKGNNRIPTSETKEKLRKLNIGKKLSEEHKAKIGKSNSISLKGSISKKRIPILQYDLEGNFIKEWNSISQIQKEFKNSDYGYIIRKNKIAHNFIWKFKNNKND